MSLRSFVGRKIGDALSRVLLRAQARVIMDRAGLRPYLSRWYVLGKPTMPDGSRPFDKYGNPKQGARFPQGPFSVYVHRFHRSDDDGAPHSHPWRWALSFVIAGGYSEERLLGTRMVRRLVPPLSLNWLTEDDFHRVDLIEKDAWTLFIVGPRTQSWFFWNRETKKKVHWREYLDHQRN